MKENSKVRDAAKAAGIPLWRIGQEMKVSEQTIIRWLRVKLPEDKEMQMLDAINRLSNKNETSISGG